MKQAFIAVLAVIAAILLWVIVPEDGKVEFIDCGNAMQLVKRTSNFCGHKQTRYGLRKNKTDLLAPCHKMVENEYLKLRVFYGQNSKIHVFNIKTGEKVLTGRVSCGRSPNYVWFSVDDEGKEDNYILNADYSPSISPLQYGIDTVAVFTVKDGKTCLVNTK